MMQAKAAGVVQSLTEIREIIKNSFEVVAYSPNPELDWEAAYNKFVELD